MIDRPKFSELIYRKDRDIPIKYDTVQLKMDGIWGCLVIKKGQWKIYSRTGNVKRKGKIADKKVDVVLLGEFMFGSHWAHMRGLDGEFYIFDCLRYKGKDIKDRELSHRLVVSDFAWNELKSELEWLDILQNYDLEDWPHLWDEEIQAQGYEGLVFKDSSSSYADKDAWARMKAIVEIEYICHGFRPADEGTRYEGQVGAVIGTLHDKEVYVTCGGLTDDMRREFTDNPEPYMGQVFKAKGNTWYPSGSLRHPKFLHWRADKEPIECTYDQIPLDIRESRDKWKSVSG